MAIFFNDDSATPTQRQLSRLYNPSRLIQPNENILDFYASYTYNVGIYLLSESDYANMIATGIPILKGSQLLIQSGGAPRTQEYETINPRTGNLQADLGFGRNQFFPLDYYLDDIKVKTYTPGKGTRSAASNVELDFTITEPNGLTFLDNLYRAVDFLVGGNLDPRLKQNYAAQHYMMVIRWYGYDHNGVLQMAQSNRDPRATTDRSAVAEKFIPFIFTNISFTVANQLVSYRCEAKVPQNYAGTGQGRGSIPYNIELSATTLGKAFSGSAEINDPDPASAPAKANAAQRPGVVTGGLVDALNQYQQKLVEDNIYEIADEYEVVFTDSVLSDAATVPPGELSKSQISNQPPQSASAKTFGAKQSADTDSKKISAVAGTTLVQFLDQVIRSSTYIYDQQIQIIDPVSGELISRGDPAQKRIVAWYRIGTQVTPKGYDYARNDFAYKITYQVSPYLVNDLQSNYFPDSVFRGVHKVYNYWFTGLNTQILNFQQDFNYLYYVVINSADTRTERFIDYREQSKRYFQPRSNENAQGYNQPVNEGGANAAERLYSPGDLARNRITIVGDPAWIPQGEVFRGIAGRNFSSSPFLEDGTINFEAEQPLYNIAFNKPADYDLNTGVADPAGKQVGGGNSLLQKTGEASQVYTYRAISVTSTFSRGKFTQDLEGVLVFFDNQKIRYSEGSEIETLVDPRNNE